MVFLFFFEGLRPSYPKKSKTSDVIVMIGVPIWGRVTGRFLIRYLLHSQWNPQPQGFSMSPAIGGWLNKNCQWWYFALENLQWGFCDVDCCYSSFIVVLHSLMFLYFRATSLCQWHSTLASEACEGLHQLWDLPRLLSITLLVHLPRALRFWVGIFYP